MFQTLFSLIDTRSFSNIWYWIAVAGAWSAVTRRVLGVPLDMVARARQDRHEEARMLVLLHGVDQRLRPGVAQVVLGSCVLTVLVVLGFGYGFALAQAIALISVPMALVRVLNLRAARRVAPLLGRGAEPVVRLLLGHHFLVQFVGFAAIGVSALYGMLQVLRAHYLGT